MNIPIKHCAWQTAYDKSDNESILIIICNTFKVKCVILVLYQTTGENLLHKLQHNPEISSINQRTVLFKLHKNQMTNEAARDLLISTILL